MPYGGNEPLAEKRGLVDMRELIKEKSASAHLFACDGAYFTAADILDELAADVRAHAQRKKDELEAMLDGRAEERERGGP